MATIYAYRPLNMADIDLSRLISYSYISNVYNNISYNNIIYKNIIEIDWLFQGAYYASIFAGNDLTYYRNSQNYIVVTGGTATGYLQLYWDGKNWNKFWSIESTSVSAVELYNNATTSSTSDDYNTILKMLSKSDSIIGSVGDDLLFGGADNDTIDGDGGSDTVIYFGTQSQYTVTAFSNGSVEVKDNRKTGATDGTDTLTNIETLRFADRTVSVSAVAAPAAPNLTQGSTSTTAKTLTISNILDNGTVTIWNGTRNVTSSFTKSGSGETQTFTANKDAFNGSETLSLTAKVTLNGVTSAASNAVTGKIDTTAPNLPIILSLDIEPPKPTITGKAEPGSTLNIYRKDVVIDTAAVNNKGEWSLNPKSRLDDGENLLTLKAIDASGNLSVGSPVIKATKSGSNLIYDFTAYVSALSLKSSPDISTSIKFIGGSGADTLTGKLANDTLDGGIGNDILTGGLGIDTFIVSSGTDTISDLGEGGADVLQVSEGAIVNATVTTAWTATSTSVNNGTANITSSGLTVDLSAITSGNGFKVTNTGTGSTLTGSSRTDTLTGGTGNDTLNSGAGNDTLNGLGGNDVLTGGTGVDTFIIGLGVDNIQDLGWDGADILKVSSGATANAWVLASSSWTATSESINNGTANISTNGSDVDLSAITLGNGFNVINTGTAATLKGSSGADTLTGGLGADTLIGGDGNDTLIGGGGNDTLQGGSGKDLYKIRKTNIFKDSITIIESGLNDIDTLDIFEDLRTASNIGLSDITQTYALDSDGSILSQMSWKENGTSKNSSLKLSGSIEFIRDHGIDDRYKNDNKDNFDYLFQVFRGTAPTLATGVAGGLGFGSANNDILIGTSKDDVVFGFSGNDTLNGLGGNDVLTGGTGVDTFIIGLGVDNIQDLGWDGADILKVSSGATANAWVLALSSWTATSESINNGKANISTNGSNVDLSAITLGNGFNVINTGTAATLKGSSGADTLTGGLGADTLSGGDGNDTLIGGGGNDMLQGGNGKDTLTGGNGSDLFVFNEALGTANVETITDFKSGIDKIQLDAGIFKSLTGITNMAGSFIQAAAALDSNDYLIFNPTTKTLLYDADGSGSGSAIQFATLTGVTGLTIDDFAIIG